MLEASILSPFVIFVVGGDRWAGLSNNVLKVLAQGRRAPYL